MNWNWSTSVVSDESAVLVFPGTNRARYEQMPEESTEAFHAFAHYRDMGSERSIDNAYFEHQDRCLGQQKRSKRATGRWTGWSEKHGWSERALAYDHELDKTKLSAFRQEAIEMGRRQAQLASSALDVLAGPALAFAKHLNDNPELLEQVSKDAHPMAMADYVSTVAAAMGTLAKMEREARGVNGEGGQEEASATVRVVFKMDEEFRL